MKACIRCAVAALLVLFPVVSAEAQVLFVNDNDNIVYNTDTVLNDLMASGAAFDTYDIPAMGVPPSASVLGNYTAVIWYCSGDGAGLGFWDASAQADLVDYVLSGNTLWVIGADVLYAQFGNPPVAFASGDFPLDAMGIATYDVQSYGDDGSLGCPQMDVTTGFSGLFAPTLLWTFSTFWWADGCTPLLGAEPIYVMGPSSYALFGSQSMFHYNPAGTNVMSTFFDPALIDTYANRVLFLEQTLAYLGLLTGIAPSHPHASGLIVTPTGSGGAVIACDVPLRNIRVHAANGQLVHGEEVVSAKRVELDLDNLAAGLHLITATTMSGEHITAKWSVR